MGRKKKTLKIIPLGGIGEIGKNMTVVQFGNDILVIDCGIMFPEEDMPGIDLVIPDTKYLEDNVEKIKGILLTHGHEDHIGAMPYVMRWLPDVPVYGTKLTLGLVNMRLKEQGMKLGNRGIVINPSDKVSIGSMTVEFIHVNHSIAGVVALAIHTPVGVVVHTADFKIDQTPIDGEVMNLRRFGELGEKGVLVLLSDSTNVEKPGYTSSERVVGELFRDTFRDAKGRIIIATFASHLARIQQVFDAAFYANRKVAIVGRSMENNVTLGIELGYIKAEKGVLISIDDIEDYADDEIVVITTGSQGEPMSALARIAMSEYRRLSIRKGDIVIVSATPIPGNERTVGKTIDRLFKQGAEVIYEKFSGVHVSGHASQEELKFLLNLVRPKYFMPVHGEYRHLVKHARLAMQVGMKEENVLIPELGGVVEFLSEGEVRCVEKIRSGMVFVDGNGVGDIGNIVLRDRVLLAQNGMVLAVVSIKSDTGDIIKEPEIFSRGFIYVKESVELIEETKQILLRGIAEWAKAPDHDVQALRDKLRDLMASFLYERTGRRPMVIPIIVDI